MVKLSLEKLEVQKLDFALELRCDYIQQGLALFLGRKTDKGLKRRAERLSVHLRRMSTDQIRCSGFQSQLKFLWAGFMN